MTSLFQRIRNSIAKARKELSTTSLVESNGKQYIIPAEKTKDGEYVYNTNVPGLYLKQSGYFLSKSVGDLDYGEKIMEVTIGLWEILNPYTHVQKSFHTLSTGDRRHYIDGVHALVQNLQTAWEDPKYQIDELEKYNMYNSIIMVNTYSNKRVLEIATLLLDSIGVRGLAHVNRSAWERANKPIPVKPPVDVTDYESKAMEAQKAGFDQYVVDKIRAGYTLVDDLGDMQIAGPNKGMCENNTVDPGVVTIDPEIVLYKHGCCITGNKDHTFNMARGLWANLGEDNPKAIALKAPTSFDSTSRKDRYDYINTVIAFKAKHGTITASDVKSQADVDFLFSYLAASLGVRLTSFEEHQRKRAVINLLNCIHGTNHPANQFVDNTFDLLERHLVAEQENVPVSEVKLEKIDLGPPTVKHLVTERECMYVLESGYMIFGQEDYQRVSKKIHIAAARVWRLLNDMGNILDFEEQSMRLRAFYLNAVIRFVNSLDNNEIFAAEKIDDEEYDRLFGQLCGNCEYDTPKSFVPRIRKKTVDDIIKLFVEERLETPPVADEHNHLVGKHLIKTEYPDLSVMEPDIYLYQGDVFSVTEEKHTGVIPEVHAVIWQAMKVWEPIADKPVTEFHNQPLEERVRWINGINRFKNMVYNTSLKAFEDIDFVTYFRVLLNYLETPRAQRDEIYHRLPVLIRNEILKTLIDTFIQLRLSKEETMAHIPMNTYKNVSQANSYNIVGKQQTMKTAHPNIEVVDQGYLVQGSGYDFQNAQLLVDTARWLFCMLAGKSPELLHIEPMVTRVNYIKTISDIQAFLNLLSENGHKVVGPTQEYQVAKIIRDNLKVNLGEKAGHIVNEMLYRFFKPKKQEEITPVDAVVEIDKMGKQFDNQAKKEEPVKATDEKTVTEHLIKMLYEAYTGKPYRGDGSSVKPQEQEKLEEFVPLFFRMYFRGTERPLFSSADKYIMRDQFQRVVLGKIHEGASIQARQAFAAICNAIEYLGGIYGKTVPQWHYDNCKERDLNKLAHRIQAGYMDVHDDHLTYVEPDAKSRPIEAAALMAHYYFTRANKDNLEAEIQPVINLLLPIYFPGKKPDDDDYDNLKRAVLKGLNFLKDAFWKDVPPWFKHTPVTKKEETTMPENETDTSMIITHPLVSNEIHMKLMTAFFKVFSENPFYEWTKPNDAMRRDAHTAIKLFLDTYKTPSASPEYRAHIATLTSNMIAGMKTFKTMKFTAYGIQSVLKLMAGWAVEKMSTIIEEWKAKDKPIPREVDDGDIDYRVRINNDVPIEVQEKLKFYLFESFDALKGLKLDLTDDVIRRELHQGVTAYLHSCRIPAHNPNWRNKQEVVTNKMRKVMPSFLFGEFTEGDKVFNDYSIMLEAVVKMSDYLEKALATDSAEQIKQSLENMAVSGPVISAMDVKEIALWDQYHIPASVFTILTTVIHDNFSDKQGTNLQVFDDVIRDQYDAGMKIFFDNFLPGPRDRQYSADYLAHVERVAVSMLVVMPAFNFECYNRGGTSFDAKVTMEKVIIDMTQVMRNNSIDLTVNNQLLDKKEPEVDVMEVAKAIWSAISYRNMSEEISWDTLLPTHKAIYQDCAEFLIKAFPIAEPDTDYLLSYLVSRISVDNKYMKYSNLNHDGKNSFKKAYDDANAIIDKFHKEQVMEVVDISFTEDGINYMAKHLHSNSSEKTTHFDNLAPEVRGGFRSDAISLLNSWTKLTKCQAK